MKNLFFIIVVLVSVIALLFLTVLYGEMKLNEDVNAKIQVFHDTMLKENPPSDADCKSGFNALVDAMELALPVAGYSTEFNDNITKANQLFKKNGILDPQGVRLLHTAYCSINDGKDFQFPGGISKISDVKEYLKKLTIGSRESLKQGKGNETVKDLLSVAIMVVTPVEKKKKH